MHDAVEKVSDRHSPERLPRVASPSDALRRPELNVKQFPHSASYNVSKSSLQMHSDTQYKECRLAFVT